MVKLTSKLRGGRIMNRLGAKIIFASFVACLVIVYIVLSAKLGDKYYLGLSGVAFVILISYIVFKETGNK